MSDANLPNSWDSFVSAGSSQSEGGKSAGTGLFMRTEKRDKPYTVRLVSIPESFRQHWQAFKSLTPKPVISPVFEVADKDSDYAWNVGGWVPTKKYAILVIDREDGKLKIMQGGEQIFGEVKKYIELQKKLGRDSDPTGPNAPDWNITVGTKEGQTHYDCSPDLGGAKPLTADEAAMVAGFKTDWRSFFKKTSPEEIKAMWEKLPEDKRYNPDPKRKGSVTADGAPVQAPTATVVATATTQAAATTPPITAAVATQPVATTVVPTGSAQAVVAATTTAATPAAKLF